MVSVEVLGSTYGEDEFRALLNDTMNTYQITAQSLSRITGMDKHIIEDFAIGGKDIPDEHRNDFIALFDLISMLSVGMEQVNENDRVRAVIEGLIHAFDISIDTLALYAKVESEEIQQFLKEPGGIPLEKRYRIAVTSLFLYYLFKQPLRDRRE